MMYLPNNIKERKKEEKAKTLYDRAVKKSEEEKKPFNENFVSRFSDKECTLNIIMKYMKKNLDNLEITISAPEFDFQTLIKSRDSNLNKKTHYVKVRELFIEYVNEQKAISDERKKEENKYAKVKEEYNMIYKAFYDKCRNELLCVTNEKGEVCTKSMILDCCIVCCYTEFREENYSHFDLLWNLFPEELVVRASGRDVVQRRKKTEEEFTAFLEGKRKSSNAKYEAIKSCRKNKIECLECRGGTPDNFSIYKSDIAEIKEKIPTSIEGYIDARKVYYVYFVAYKMLKSMKQLPIIPCTENSRTGVTYSCISRVTGLNRKSVEKAVKILQEHNVIKYNCRGRNKNCVLLFKPKENCIEKLYYNGIDYMKAFNVMKRHLSK